MPCHSCAQPARQPNWPQVTPAGMLARSPPPPPPPHPSSGPKLRRLAVVVVPTLRRDHLLCGVTRRGPPNGNEILQLWKQTGRLLDHQISGGDGSERCSS